MTPRKSASTPHGSWIDQRRGAERGPTIISTQRWNSAPTRSILLTKQIRGTPYLSAWRQTVSDCGSTPATRVEHRDGAVEHPQRALHLDGEVDVPGRVDDVDRCGRRQLQVVAAEVMVMPRSCSCSIQSMVAAPSWTSPIL